MTDRYRRNRGVVRRPASGHPELGSVNDRGRDAPMGPPDVRLFQAIIAIAVILIVVLGVVAWRG